MGKPSIKTVSEWDLVYESDLVEVYSGTSEFPEDYWKVIPAGEKAQYFYGESAWMNARRVAADIDFGAWAI